MGNGKVEVRLPDVEIIVRCAAYDVAVLAFYQREGTDLSFDVLTGIASEAEVSVVVTLLQDAIKALHVANWEPLSTFDDANGHGTEPPF